MTTLVDLPAVRPGRLAARLVDAPLQDEARALRTYLRGAEISELPEGVRLAVRVEVPELAALAEVVRALADQWPFFCFRLRAEPPVAWLEVEGMGPAIGVARAVFGELAA